MAFLFYFPESPHRLSKTMNFRATILLLLVLSIPCISAQTGHSHNHTADIIKSLSNRNDGNRLLVSYLDSLSDDQNAYEEAFETAHPMLSLPSSPFRNRAMEKILLHHAVDNATNPAFQARLGYLSSLSAANLPGETAPDFKMLLHDGSLTTLHEIVSNGNILMILLDPDCGHCKKTIDSISRLTLTSVSKILAVDISGDRQRFEETPQALPGSWISGFALPPFEEEEPYNLPETPVIYLIDKTGRILIKEASLGEVTEL